MSTKSPGREEKKARAGPPLVGYAENAPNLADHLRRVLMLVKAQTLRWRATIAADKPDKLWGMVHVTDTEVQSFLGAQPDSAPEYPPDINQAIDELRKNAGALAQTIEDNELSTQPGTLLRVRRLRELFSLGPEERDILLICLLPEMDARIRRLYGYLQDDASRTQPTVELVAAIQSGDERGVANTRKLFEPGAALMSNRMVVIRSRAEEPLGMRPLRLDDRIGSFLLGIDEPDARLLGVLTQPEPLAPEALIAEPQQVERIRALSGKVRGQYKGNAIFLRGPYGSGKLNAARAIATAVDKPLICIEARQAARLSANWDEFVDVAFREALLRDAAICWKGCEALLEQGQPPDRWDHLISAAEQFPGIVLFGSETAWDPGGRFQSKPFLRVEMGVASYALRKRIWAAHMPAESEFREPAPARDTLIEALAGRFQLTEGQILDSIRAARVHATSQNPRDAKLSAEDLFEGCRRQSGRKLLAFSRRIEPRSQLKFTDLVLPDANLRQLREVQTRIRLQQQVQVELGFDQRLRLGRGMVVLFTGSSGTGKTMAAEWLARELGVDLYKADLSAVVSKWVGETEKNLNQLFGEAEDSSAIIFFDEADALFGKRGEVKDARDRWANTEVNFLLQRVEEYSGVVILASNLRQNIDEAFLRRISAMVEFPAPDEDARAKIWLGMFPPALRRPSDDEIRSLSSRVRLPGGSVRNIVLDAAFRAVAVARDEPPVVTLRHLVAATAREFQKLGKPIVKAELGELFYSWIEEDIL